MRRGSLRLPDPFAPAKPSKHRNKKVALDGITFDSTAECNRYAQLKLMQKAGLISDLKCQVTFELVPGVKIKGAARASPAIRYVADFVYKEGGIQVVEDTKGFLTPIYKMKRHMMLAILGIHIRETK